MFIIRIMRGIIIGKACQLSKIYKRQLELILHNYQDQISGGMCLLRYFKITRVIEETRLTYDELYIVLILIEVCLNSRPLCTLSHEPNDLILNSCSLSHLRTCQGVA